MKYLKSPQNRDNYSNLFLAAESEEEESYIRSPPE
jgi:hypothetical protein